MDSRPRRLGLPDLKDWPLRALVFSGFAFTPIPLSPGCLQFCPGSLYCLGYAMVLLNKYQLPGAFKMGLDLCPLQASLGPFQRAFQTTLRGHYHGQ